MPDTTVSTMYRSVVTREPSPPDTPLRHAAHEVLFGQIWTRPGITRRQRRWISLTAATLAGPGVGVESHVYGAMNSCDITPTELGEFVLHLAPLVGWPRVAWLDALIRTTTDTIRATSGSLAAPVVEPMPETPLTELAGAGATPLQALLGDAMQDALVWRRPGLAPADRRLVSIVALAIERAADLLVAHVAAASADDGLDEPALREVALHAGFYAGLPAARLIDDAVTAASSTRAATPATPPERGLP